MATLIEELSVAIDTWKRTRLNKRLDPEVNRKWEARIDTLMKMMPSGAGIDNGTKLDWDKSAKDPDKKIVLTCDYHHMNSNGFYTHWTHHSVYVMATFGEFYLRFSGDNDNDIKDYLNDVYVNALNEEAPPLDWAAL